jgi:hypothetical protein
MELLFVYPSDHQRWQKERVNIPRCQEAHGPTVLLRDLALTVSLAVVFLGSLPLCRTF